MKEGDEIRGFRGTKEDGWAFELVLFHQQPRGEIRFTLHGAPKFTVAIGVDEIALFAARRWDLVADYINRLIAEHRPH